MNSDITTPRVDLSAVRVSQSATILVLLAAFALDAWPLVAILAVINLVGALVPALSLWRQLYVRALVPMGLVKPQVIPDHPEPHRFAQGVGAALATISAVLLAGGLQVAGWTAAWVLILLAALNVFVGFCLGCFTYYQLNRLGVPGFRQGHLEEGS